MEKIYLSRENISKLVEKNKHNIIKNKGGFGIVLPYDKDFGLKFSVDLLRDNFFDEEKFNNNLEEYKISEWQIECLVNAQERVKLTSLPKGIAYYNNKPVAVILKYFYNHKNLYESYMEHNAAFFRMLKETILALDELMKNGIYQLDAKGSNFLYSKPSYKIETIDLDGELIKLSRENIVYEQRIYEDLIDMFDFLFKEKLMYLKRTNQINDNDYYARLSSLRCLKNSIRGFHIYESAEGFVNEVKKSKMLAIKKTRQ